MNVADNEQGLSPMQALQMRARLNAEIRRFFSDRQVLEVETPMLSAAGNTDPNIESFQTVFTGHESAGASRRWLRTSPEYPLKRLLAAGVGDCYELGRVFRNGEAGARHNPEFSLLEWYRVGWDHHRLMVEAAELIEAGLALGGHRPQRRTLSYRDWFFESLAVDPHTAPLAELQAVLADVRIDPADLSHDDWLDLIVTHRLQSLNPGDQLLIIHDYPASQCALARLRPGEVSVAQRFEIYVGAHELANGYHELKDADEQARRFQADHRLRQQRGQLLPDIDQRLLHALPMLPDCAGVALGVDRLLMCLTGVADIRQLLAFDFARA